MHLIIIIIIIIIIMSTIRKKPVKQQYVLHMSPQRGELLPTSG